LRGHRSASLGRWRAGAASIVQILITFKNIVKQVFKVGLLLQLFVFALENDLSLV
jgi:hypothetical protein